MSLRNLLGISLDSVTPDRAQLSRLLKAAERNIADARLDGLSPENRFDMAYKAIMQVAMVALNANGYRTLTSKPGHHRTVIQALTLTVGLPAQTVIVLDALRKQRNASDYSGDVVPDSVATECLLRATELLACVRAWMQANRPDLL